MSAEIGNKIIEGNTEINIEQKEQNNGLNKEQKQKLTEFLQQKKENEKKKVIHITSTELQELKTILDTIQVGKNTEKLDDFLEKQTQETITTAEMMAGTELEKKLGTETMSALSNILEKYSYNHFFSNEGSLSKINISEDAKRNFSVGATLFHMEQIIEAAEKSGNPDAIKSFISLLSKKSNGNHITEIINSATQTILQNISLFNMSSNNDNEKVLSEILQEIETEGNNIENGEELEVFMNPAKGKELLKMVQNGKTKENIKKFIEDSRKTPQPEASESDEKSLNSSTSTENEEKSSSESATSLAAKAVAQEVGNKLANTVIDEETGEEVQNAHQNLQKAIEKDPEAAKEAIKENGGLMEVLGEIPIIGEFLKAFFEYMESLETNSEGGGNIKGEMEALLSEDQSLFGKKELPENFMKKDDGSTDTEFQKDIHALIGGEKKGEELQTAIKHLFAKDGELNAYIQEQHIDVYDSSGNIDYANLKIAIHGYKKTTGTNKESENVTSSEGNNDFATINTETNI